jgi:hypothetical protein
LLQKTRRVLKQKLLENIFGGRTCRTRDIIQIKIDFVENVFEGETWKIKVPNL